MESRSPRQVSVAADESRALLSLSRDLIFWQGEAQRQQEAGERQSALRQLALQILGGRPTDWAATMAVSAAKLIPKLGADCWYFGALDAEAAPEIFVSATSLSAPPHSGVRCLEQPVVAEMATQLCGGYDWVISSTGQVGGLLWMAVRSAGFFGLSGCHSISRPIVASDAVRALLHGLGEIAMASHLRCSADRAAP
jgi:hypothetical protein